MSLPVSVPYAFANATTTQNLSSLDSNFNALANGLNGLANGASQISVSSISATGTANSNTYLRGDGAWATVSGGGSDVTYANVTVTQNLVPPSSFLRNRIINGAMQIDQRWSGIQVTIPAASGTYILDRWWAYATLGSKYTCQQTPSATETGYATRVAAGFTNYFAVTSLAATTPAATDIYIFGQKVEGLNVYDVAWGASSAKTVTMSFWVNSSLTGLFGGTVLNSANTRCYVFSYTINAANTWEQKTITIAGDTSGTWLTTNGIGIQLYFDVGCGATYKGAAGSWGGTLYYGVTGGTNVIGTNGATFYITGVQLEVGTVATPFERRQYGQELMLCQRYYLSSTVSIGAWYNGDGSNVGKGSYVPFKVTMRTTPTISFTNISASNTSTDNASNSYPDGFSYVVNVVATGNYTRVSTFNASSEL